MTEDQLTILIQRYLSGEATDAEKMQIEAWYDLFDKNSLEFLDGDPGRISASFRVSLEAIKRKIRKKRQHSRISSVNHIRWWHIAATLALIAVLSGVIYSIYFKKAIVPARLAAQNPHHGIQPGGNKATLTLGNGQRIVLDSTSNGILSVQGNTTIVKLNSGQLAYNNSNEQPSRILYNTISTPRGGQYQITLPDDTKVWLNSSSSIRFPTAFTGNDRKVTVSGEAYFEVAENKDMPFKVLMNGMEIQVMGTHFNVMSYSDMATMSTTLLEGSVKVKKGKDILWLKPGQKAQVDSNGEMKLIKAVNTQEVIAWKNDLFWFDNDDVQEVMRQLSRWYDVDIVISGDIPGRFTGSIPRDIAFSKVFEVLQTTGGIHYKLQGGKVIVSP